MTLANPELDYSLEPGETKRVSFALSGFDLSALSHSDVELVLSDGEEEARYSATLELLPCRYRAAPAAIDGDLQEWKRADPCVVLDQRALVYPDGSTWKGPDDLSVRAWLGWDKDFFYFAAEVKDQGEGLWNGDGLEMAFSASGAGDDYSDVSLSLSEPGSPRLYRYRGGKNSGLKPGVINEAPLVIT
ncbi:MAG: hypothetical protein GX608_13805, partial [Lentisphaerae bacterium]|nr:hypothetical protein [Lentisphaerota bacterium]